MTGKIFGALGSYPEYKIVKDFRKSSVVITSDIKRQKIFLNDAKAYTNFFDKKIKILEVPEGKDPCDLEAQIKRNFFLLNLVNKEDFIAVGTKKSFDIPVRKEFEKDILKIEVNKEINREELISKLIEFGYIREEYIENEGEFSIKGGFIFIHIPFTGIAEIDLFGDTVENLFLKSKLETRKKIETVYVYPLYDKPVELKNKTSIQFKEVDTVPLSSYLNDLEIFYIDLYEDLLGKKAVYFYTAGKNENILTTKEINPTFKIHKLSLRQPLVLKNEKESFIPEDSKGLKLEIEPLKEGDYIIHEDYGIGIFRGIETREIRGKKYDFMILEYADNEKVYVSYLHFDKIHKYKASGVISLDKIGGTSWRNLKRKVKNSLKKVAHQLVKLYSERQSIKRNPLDINNELIHQFERDFPFIETPDQLKAVKDVKKDLSSEKPMERIICGDVGFGKTEVALRAVFINVVNGKQALVLVPTTVLSYQHYRKFKERLEPYGIVVENLSRLKSKKETEEILKKLKDGEIDVVIGTHKALQDNVRFKNLGLLIIDEEHRFGVRAKEKIRQLKKDIDTLYMTATPIPRTLNMALSGLKDMSVINTPPEGRIETKTYVSVFNEEVVKKAIKFELDRKGQIFFLHNRIETIQERAAYIKSLFPEAKVSIAHGRMKPKEIEKVILSFIEGKTDILVSTSIIETGIDIPTANTLIIERADLFGLAQLYHLRGRVGRGNIQAYCYLLVPSEITEDAEKRLDVILRMTRPGSGLKVSIEDMQIRGVGNILGVQQSGHIKAVGYEMYIKLLQESINEETGKEEKEPVIQVDFDSYIPEDFIPDPKDRMNIYMAVAKASDISEINEIQKYMKDFYNGLPAAFNLYLEISKLKKAVKNKGIEKIELQEPVTTIYFDRENPPDPNIIMRITKELNVKKISSDKICIFLSKEEIPKLTQVFIRNF
ncbi:transcription-repair coupling factor [Persephonella sp.]